MDSDPYISVLLATYRRPACLDAALADMARSDLGTGRFEVIVCDNADDPDTRRVCEAHAAAMTVRYLVEPRRGKSHALNRAIGEARGELFVFTDDDILAPAAWLRETRDGAARWPHQTVFGGRVLPEWPDQMPGFLEGSPYLGPCFTVLDPEAPEGPLPDFRPFGPNMAVRRAPFDRGLRFDVHVGPSAGSYVMGNETELARRLAEDGEEAVFLPRSVVRHRIRAEQLGLRWLLSRGVRFGRSLEYAAAGGATGSGPPARIPAWMVREGLGNLSVSVARWVRGDRAGAFERAMDAAVTWGRMRQRWTTGLAGGKAASRGEIPAETREGRG